MSFLFKYDRVQKQKPESSFSYFSCSLLMFHHSSKVPTRLKSQRSTKPLVAHYILVPQPNMLGQLCTNQNWAPCFQTSVFFTGEFQQKVDLKNVISTDTNEFSWENWSRFAKFRTIKNSNRHISISSSRQPRIQKDPVFFLLSYLACRQNWVKEFLDGRHLGYITKSFKKNPVSDTPDSSPGFTLDIQAYNQQFPVTQ